ncbi:stromal cell-derived factor 2-like protein 1 [Hippocampus comes]|uniref:Stromal cell-derived factor 2-like 1 n=1 Tax=Hippocampus comes TaxID=109280 RepID=A0A3Q2Y4L9_HIPCM|nr:PREDICTED: stromal cell-derived factor 2-like protein 1 [Hippocampus comes]XP_019711721.1 PREDICTED: stromal cell-derived factor 2-like protein 1 [Hippocampus comes]
MKMESSYAVLLKLLVFFVLWSHFEGRETEYKDVTCGSLVKLMNTRHSVRLHSHDVKYGSGSGQQSVTGVENADDGNSYWQIRGKANHPCQRGTAIKCGQPIRFTHMKTGRNLHTHHFSSPLSNNQEVSAFGENGEGDDLDVWTVQCDGVHWERNDAVRFKHVGTNVFLSVTGEQYGPPIRGQWEVHGMTSPNQHNWWQVMEGVFIQPSQDPLHQSAHHTEL